MKITCPECDRPVPAKDLALDTGWGKCLACDSVFPLAGVLTGYSPPAKANGQRLKRPFDARAQLDRDQRRVAIHVPPAGMSRANWGLLGSSIFCLAFVAFWTAGVLGFGQGPIGLENGLFAGFSIPFWLIGIGMLGSVLWMSRSSRAVWIDAAQMVTQWRCLALRRTRNYDRDQVQRAREAEIERPQSRNTRHYQAPQPAVELVYRGGAFKLPCANEAERAWLVAEINDFLARVPYDPRAGDVMRREFEGHASGRDEFR